MAVHLNVGPPGTGNLAYWGKGVLVVFRGKEGRVGAGVVGRGSGWEGVFRQGGVGSAMRGTRVCRPTGRDQTCTPQGEPTFRKGGGAKGGRKGAGAAEWIRLGREGCRNRCLLVLFFRRGTRLLVL